MTNIRFITADEISQFRAAIEIGFGGDPTEEDGADERFAKLFNVDTCMAAFDGTRMVSTFGSIDFDLSVPGGTLPMAGTTIVTVQPTHRRQGILTRMMTTHLRQAVDRKQPIAGLWASEAPIYGRFGYGSAAHGIELKLSAGAVSLPPGSEAISLKSIDHDEAAEILPAIYDMMYRATPGMLSRSTDWWTLRRLRDSERHRNGMSSRRIVVAYENDRPLGYLLYRQKEGWENNLPNGKISITELITTNEEARRALWRYVTNVDLFPSVEWWNTPVDYPLFVEVDNPRSLTVKQNDTLWLRILDVATCLERRTYETDGRVVFTISDDVMDSEGTYVLEVRDGVGACTRTDDDAEVSMGISDLSAIFLGGNSAIQRHRAGRVQGTTDAVSKMDRLFRTSIAPFALEVF